MWALTRAIYFTESADNHFPIGLGSTELMRVTPGSETWTNICHKVHRQMDTVKIIRIERVQSEWLWEGYAIGKQRLCIKNKGEVNEKELYHGSSSTPTT